MVKLTDRTLHIALVAGEHSGDVLGADLMHRLQQACPNIRFSGIGGALMQQQGMQSFYPMDAITAIGFTEVLRKLPYLLRLRRHLAKKLLAVKPDLFISIDAPDFNLGLAMRMKQAGVPVVHYVSPTIWAWRKKRVHKIKKATDIVLCLYPFEVDIYRQQQHAALFVGHPLAHAIAMQSDKQAARIQLGLDVFAEAKKHPVMPASASHVISPRVTKPLITNPGVTEPHIIALLPGSRASEIKYLGQHFLEVARCCHAINSRLMFLIAAANQQCFVQIQTILQHPHLRQLPVRVCTGQSGLVLSASDVVLVASGTATLEAMLVKRPMTVAYRLHPFNYWLLSRMVQTEYVAQPNWLAGKKIVPEWLQQQANIKNLTESVMANLSMVHTPAEKDLIKTYTQIHQELRSAEISTAIPHILSLIK